MMLYRSICCAGHDDSSRDMLNGNGFATSRWSMSFGGHAKSKRPTGPTLIWRTGGCDRFRIRDDVFSRESASAGFGPQCKSHGCNESRRCRATSRCWVCLVAGRTNTFRFSCASACSELMARKLVASLSFVQIAADEFGHMLQSGEFDSYSSTMAGELQHLVDATGRRLDRSVAIDDSRSVYSRTTRTTAPSIQSE